MKEMHAVSVEKKIIAVALFVSFGHLLLIAYAAYVLGIDVPGCTTQVKPFDVGSLTKQGLKRYEAHVLARMWAFEPSKIVVPTGSIVDLYLTSKDVTHGFQITGTNTNLTAVPQVVNYARVRFNRPGIYPMICHEYCGTGHQSMNGVIEVRNDVSDATAEGLQATAAGAPSLPTGTTLSAGAAAGQMLFQTKGCAACHSINGAPGVGPTFKGLFGRGEALADGTTVTVDDAYVRESIVEPQKKIVKGFNPVMPKLPLSDAEIDQLIQYLKTL
jgi:cytochrome c oxidase subunit 2